MLKSESNVNYNKEPLCELNEFEVLTHINWGRANPVHMSLIFKTLWKKEGGLHIYQGHGVGTPTCVQAFCIQETAFFSSADKEVYLWGFFNGKAWVSVSISRSLRNYHDLDA